MGGIEHLGRWGLVELQDVQLVPDGVSQPPVLLLRDRERDRPDGLRRLGWAVGGRPRERYDWRLPAGAKPRSPPTAYRGQRGAAIWVRSGLGRHPARRRSRIDPRQLQE